MILISFIGWCMLLGKPAIPGSHDASSCFKPTAPPSCFEKYADRLDEWLTREDIVSIFPGLPAEAAINYSRNVPIAYRSSVYQWKSDRFSISFVGSREVRSPRPNKIGVGHLSVYGDRVKDPLTYFRNAHRTPTAEEKSELQQRMKTKMEEKGLTSSQKGAGTTLTAALSEQILFTNVEGLGDAAAWDHMDHSLVILVGRVRFKVFVEISGNVEDNQELAIKLAKKILEKC